MNQKTNEVDIRPFQYKKIETVKRSQSKLSEMKDTIYQIKNSHESMANRLCGAENRTGRQSLKTEVQVLKRECMILSTQNTIKGENYRA